MTEVRDGAALIASVGDFKRVATYRLNQGVEEVCRIGCHGTGLGQVCRLGSRFAAATAMMVVVMDLAGPLGRSGLGLNCETGLRRGGL